MENKFIDQVLMKLNDRYTIAVTKDHNSGIVVQVARMNPTHVRGDNGVAFHGHQPVVVWQRIIPLGTKNSSGELTFRDSSAIDADLKVTLGQAQQYGAKCSQTEASVDALLSALQAEVNK